MGPEFDDPYVFLTSRIDYLPEFPDALGISILLRYVNRCLSILNIVTHL